jgi:hypothetical protein
MIDFDKIISRQQVRLLDVFVVAPFLFYAASKQSDNKLKYGLYGLAALTLVYNGVNYLNEKKDGK